MDYIETFKNLRTNNKYGRKSPHKAVLMLTVIELYEQNILTENEICYDDKLKKMFLKVWNKVLPYEQKFHPDAYLPYWYLQNDSFWHIVPKRDKEAILSSMRDNRVKPSETSLYDSVKYAELDEDLYFLMTLSSGRSSLKRVLLETYFDLTDEQIDKLSESVDNSVDYSLSAIADYEQILSKKQDETKVYINEPDKELTRQFHSFNEDIQIVLNIQYYTFLKSHRNEREVFKELFPTVYDLLDKIINEPIKQRDISPSFAFVYDNFLSDLKISLMSEDDAMCIIDKITEAIDLLRGNNIKEVNLGTVDVASKDSYSDSNLDNNIISTSQNVILEEDSTETRKGQPWTQYEEELISLYYNKGMDVKSIAERQGRTEIAIKSRLAKLGLIEYTYQAEEETNHNNDNEYEIKNYSTKCFILNQEGNIVFSDEGILIKINGEIYRCKLQKVCFTIKKLFEKDGNWSKGGKVIVAYSSSDLYPVIDNDSIEKIEDIVYTPNFVGSKIKVDGIWYNNEGNRIFVEDEDKGYSEENSSYRTERTSEIYVPKGKLKAISDIAECSYDFLWVMAIVEFMQLKPQPSVLTYDRMACMMIAIAWELMNNEVIIKDTEDELLKCVEFLIEENKDKLSWNSSRREVYKAIEKFPMYDVFEDTVDSILEVSPLNVLRAWFKDENKEEIIELSKDFEKACLYAIYSDKREPYIVVNKKWQRSLFLEYDNLMNYFKNEYLDFLENC
ncbi:MAG: hypothetical protein IJ914_01705 [Prevotella sp.]|nr:hypothetical protein [Prevotella sp.]